MDTRYALEPEHLDELIADPAPFADYLDDATDYTVFRSQISDAVDWALTNCGLTFDEHRRPVIDSEVWRQANRKELAEKIALHQCAGLAPQMEQHNMRAILGALELAKKSRTEGKAPSA